MAFNSLCKDDLLRPRIRSTLSLTPRSRSSYQTPPLTELQRLLWTHKPSTGHVNEVWPNLYVGDLYTARDKDQLRRMGITHIVNAAAGRFHIDTGAKFYRDLPVDYYGIEADDDPNFDLSIYFYQAARYIRAALNSPRELHLRPDSVLLHYCKSRVMPLKSELLHIYASVTEQETFPARVQLNANANLQFLIKSAEGEESSVDIDERSPWKIIRLTTCGEKGRVLVHCAMGISRSATLVLAFLMICENKTLVDAIQAVCKHRGVCPNSGFLKQLWELDMRLAREKGRGIDPLRL